MASPKAAAAAVRLQQAVREYLETNAATTCYPATREPAQMLLQSLADSGVSDHQVPRGRRLKRVSDKKVNAARKRINYLVKRNADLQKQLKQATDPKRGGQILALW